jgi:Domain of unknown function (DUF4838)
MAKIFRHLLLLATVALISYPLEAVSAKPTLSPSRTSELSTAGQFNTFILAEGGRTAYQIVLSKNATEVERFAAQELQRYLNRITGATFPIVHGGPTGKAILIGPQLLPAGFIDSRKLGFDGFIYQATPGKILLAGVNGRATLFSVYAFLRELGCRWFAPNFDFYGSARGEVIPKADPLMVPDLDKAITPSMKYRRLDIEEGRTHTIESLVQMIDWMPKIGMNVLQCPLNYQGRGHTEWDNWRTAMIPELKKRDLLIEVGGHGYQNFLPQATYFQQHPDWFGMIDGKRSDATRVVFETANPQAMHEFLHNIKAYLQAHPEIDILDLWPPDGAQWSQSPESQKLGSPTHRHALVVNAVARMVKADFAHMKVEFLAYQNYLFPPRDVKFEDNTIMDFCPIGRTYQEPIWDPQSSLNKMYMDPLQEWLKRDVFKGDILIYTYYHKYSWRSLPIDIPKLITEEIHYYKSLGVSGMGIYSEPANWFTYETNHYFFARGLMDANMDAAQELHDYASKRFGPAGIPIEKYFQILEETTPKVCSIPGSAVQDADQVQEGLDKLEEAQKLLGEADRTAVRDPGIEALISKLHASLEYTIIDVRIRLLAWKIARGGGWADSARGMAPLFYKLRSIFLSHQGEGIFLVPSAYTNYVPKDRKVGATG